MYVENDPEVGRVRDARGEPGETRTESCKLCGRKESAKPAHQTEADADASS